jgi:hypothetical protein
LPRIGARSTIIRGTPLLHRDYRRLTAPTKRLYERTKKKARGHLWMQRGLKGFLLLEELKFYVI